ncbi:PEP-CTERM sorting domain-containing protein [Nostoc sp. FACHB-87]|uniref:PEP-CTERM sorting domain-containing protein n=1 Tax=Nostocales TaxID=1161 RepID=UPI0016872AEE|nr:MULTISPECIES: PEP-CTERM sorting domain-containing protein [Nostocales]MBD2457254.1 PEP-CTERM sorting domain-containing protein [Nostoc sp. FACHB-87]MBD2475202.1 PEP-CTERM sorting domain-containing protein [Anabaena sp. FACHB-83]MBD2489090.1 PEP-CTERM sorting domain-containing protein [Aulosira sp. FACHB-615]
MKQLSSLPSVKFLTSSIATLAISLISSQSATAATIALGFTKLTGVTGGSPANTAVLRAEIPAISFGKIASIVIKDISDSNAGSPGNVTGFDLDAIKLSYTAVDNAADVNTISALDLFDFSPTGTVLTPGSQRPPASSALFGTTGGNVNNAVATLGNFDANSTTDPTKIFGFFSLGNNGQVAFKLKSPITTNSPLYIYLGEVGDNGELATGEIIVSQPAPPVPEPSSLAVLSLAGIYLAVRYRRKNG